jgi:hypothetical protein
VRGNVVEERAGGSISPGKTPSSTQPPLDLEQGTAVIHPSTVFLRALEHCPGCAWASLLTIHLKPLPLSFTFRESPDVISGKDAVRNWSVRALSSQLQLLFPQGVMS